MEPCVDYPALQITAALVIEKKPFSLDIFLFAYSINGVITTVIVTNVTQLTIVPIFTLIVFSNSSVMAKPFSYKSAQV